MIQWVIQQRVTGYLRCSIQAINITGIEGSRIFYLEENKVDTIDNNLLPWVEVDEALEEAEALERGEAQEEVEASMQAEEIIPLPERRKRSRGYLKP